MSALCASLVAPPSDSNAPVPEVQESLLGSPTADGPSSEEYAPGGEGAGHRRSNRTGYRHSRARVLRERAGDASGAEGQGAELGGDGARTPTAVWGAVGQRPTEGPSSIRTMGPCPPPPSGAGTNPSRGTGRIAAGRPERLREGQLAAPSLPRRHTRGCWRADASAEGGRGCRQIPLNYFICS